MPVDLRKFAEIKREYQKKIVAEGEGFIKALFKEFFDKYTFVDQIKWVQYTPYFNDGDPCVFSLGEIRFHIDDCNTIRQMIRQEYLWRTERNWQTNEHKFIRPLDNNELLDTGEDIYDWGWTHYSVKDNHPFKKAFAELVKVLSEVEDVLEEIFGDHAEVIVHRDRIEVNEYDHD